MVVTPLEELTEELLVTLLLDTTEELLAITPEHTDGMEPDTLSDK